MPEYHNRGNQGIGLVIALLGILFLFDHFNILNFGSIIGTWWPLILLLVGFLKFTGDERNGGMVLLVLGCVFLLANLNVLHWHDILGLWPVILIIVGLSMAFGGRRYFGHTDLEVAADQFDVKVVFGGAERRITSQGLKGGEIMALFGGAEVDLRDASPARDCRIRINVMFGGAEVRVPSEWRIIITGTPILGGIEDKTRQAGDQGPVVRIHCSAMFGGIEIRN